MRRLGILCGVLPLAALVAACGCSRAPIERDRVEWIAMGTVASLQTRGTNLAEDVSSSAVLARALSVTKDVESLLNAHSPDSELSRLAALSDGEVLESCDRTASVDASVRARPCYEAAFALAKASGGAFNPRWHGTNTLDLGAIAKGFAVDLAADAPPEGSVDMLLDFGGNLKSLRGIWRTGMKNPNGGGFAAVVELREGEALATSATYYRGSHIYDGRTGKPVTNGVVSVTVLCDSAMWADGLSTTLFVLGPDEGRAFLDGAARTLVGGRGVAALWVLSDGRQTKFDPDARFLCGSEH